MNVITFPETLLTASRATADGSRLLLDWSLAKAEFVARFDAPSLTLTLALGYGTLADLRVLADGEEIAAFTLTEPTPITRTVSIPVGIHRITLIKDTQARSGGIDLTELLLSGELLDPPAPAPVRVAIIGDSISCGAGALPTDRDEARADQARASYGALLAERLKAEVEVCAVSGWGIACGGHDENALIPRIYEKRNAFRDDAPMDFSSCPDLLIVALGTNDYRFAAEGREEVLERASRAFLARLRELYPDACILWVYGQMLGQYHEMLRSMVEGFGDPRMAYLPLPRNVEGGFGHPNAEGHRVFADCIAEFVEARFPELLR